MEGRCGAESAHWIPGSHRFDAVREDNRKVRDLWVINSLSDYPSLKSYKYEFPGDKYVTQNDLTIIDIIEKTAKKAEIDVYKRQIYSWLYKLIYVLL